MDLFIYYLGNRPTQKNARRLVPGAAVCVCGPPEASGALPVDHPPDMVKHIRPAVVQHNLMSQKYLHSKHLVTYSDRIIILICC
jgi:hypothetical protein